MRRSVVVAALAVLTLTGCTDPYLSIDLIFHRHGPEVVAEAHRIADCESGHRPDAVSPGGGNFGVLQINAVHRAQFEQVTGQPWSQVTNAWWNVYYGHWLYERSGWQPWSCRPGR